jgi:hypothetical protein
MRLVARRSTESTFCSRSAARRLRVADNADRADVEGEEEGKTPEEEEEEEELGPGGELDADEWTPPWRPVEGGRGEDESKWIEEEEDCKPELPA